MALNCSLICKILVPVSISYITYLAFTFLQVPIDPKAFLSFSDYCYHYGYTVETYNVQTSDNYTLSVFRLPGKGSPVLLLPGLVITSDCFIINQCDKAPAFKLADSGFDVWIGNFRGSPYSRNHTTHDQDSADFWDFSLSEMHEFDLIAFIDVINSQTPSKISVIGYSLGGVVISTALALLPEYYIDRISIAILIATPGGTMNPESFYINFIGSRVMQWISKIFGMFKFLDRIEGTFLYRFVLTCPSISRFFASDMMDLDMHNVTNEDFALYSQRLQGGTSVKLLEMIRQQLSSGSEKPVRFDYGEEENLKRYNSIVPPKVDFMNIVNKIAVMNFKYDRVFTQEDSKAFKNSINNEAVVFYKDDYPLDHAANVISCDSTYMDDAITLLKDHST